MKSLHVATNGGDLAEDCGILAGDADEAILMDGMDEVGREIWLDDHGGDHNHGHGHGHHEDDDLIVHHDPSIFYGDLPTLPDFPCMSSSSSSSTSPAPVNAIVSSASSSSAASSSTSSAASWAILRSDGEDPAQNQNQYGSGNCDVDSSAALQSTASMEIPLDNGQGFGCGEGGGDCIDMMETFGYMDLLDSNEFFDTSAIFSQDGFSELESSKSGQESSSSSSSDDSEVDEGNLSADEEEEEEELELDLTETEDSRKTVEKKPSELFKTIVSAAGLSVGSALDKWVEEGNEINRIEVAKAMLQLRKRRMFGRALQMSEWLEANKKIEMNERDYASRLDLIVKTRGLEKGEAYMDKIPKSFRGEVMYRTLLANCVVACNVKKSELVFNRMKDLGFPRSGFTCEQMLLLYKRVDRKKIADVLLLMEKENVKPSLLTYKILIDVKGSSNDINGMEQIVETMKEEGVEPDFHTLAVTARHYSGAGLKEKAEKVLKEMEGESLQANRRAFKDLLSIYASLGREDEVRRIWKICESRPRFEESLAAIHAFGKLNKVQEAEEIFEKIVKMDRRASSNTYSVLLRVYVDHKMLSKGKDLVKRMAETGCRIEASTWDALIRLYVEAGEVEKADSLLNKASKQSHTKLMMSSFMYIMDEYAKRGDIHNTEKIFLKMREVGYTSRLRQFQALMQAYINAKAPAYGMRDRMKADNIFPNKSMAAQLAQGDPFKKTAISDILD